MRILVKKFIPRLFCYFTGFECFCHLWSQLLSHRYFKASENLVLLPSSTEDRPRPALSHHPIVPSAGQQRHATSALPQRGKLSVWKHHGQHFRLERSPRPGRSRKEEGVITPPPPSHLLPHCSMEESSSTPGLRTLINSGAHFLIAEVTLSEEMKVKGGCINQEAFRLREQVID